MRKPLTLAEEDMSKSHPDNDAYLDRVDSFEDFKNELFRILSETNKRLTQLMWWRKKEKTRRRKERQEEKRMNEEQAIYDRGKIQAVLEENRLKAEEEVTVRKQQRAEQAAEKARAQLKQDQEEAEQRRLVLLQKEEALEKVRLEIAQLQADTAQQRPIQPTGVGPNTATTTKLPKLKMTPFEGNSLEWQSFRDRFESQVHLQPGLRNVDKFNYLSEFLTGKAAKTIAGIQCTNDNYDEAWNLLCDTYGQKGVVLKAHHRALRDLGVAKNHTDSLRTTFNEMERHLRSLAALGEPIDNNSTLFSFLIDKVPPEIVMSLEQQARLEKKDFDMKYFRTGLQKLIEEREFAYGVGLDRKDSAKAENGDKNAKGSQSENKRTFGGKRPGQFGLSTRAGGSTGQSKTAKCVFCEGPHWGDLCQNFPTFEARRKRLQDMRKCFVCLGTGHIAAKCEKSPFCRNCKQNARHYRSLCRALFEKTGPPGRSANLLHKKEVPETIAEEKESQPTTTQMVLDLSCHSAGFPASGLQDKIKVSYYKTVVTDVINPDSGTFTKIRLLFDSGSGNSYITEECAKRLQLRTLRKEVLNVYTFSAKNSVSKTTRRVRILLRPPFGTEHILELNTVDCITSHKGKLDFPTLPPYIDKSKLADSGEDLGPNATIDIMIGCEHIGLFKTGEHLQVSDSLWLEGSTFGYLLYGSYLAQGGPSDVEVRATLAMFSHVEIEKEPSTPLSVKNDDFVPDLQTFTSLETLGIRDDPQISAEDEAIAHFNKNISFNQETGRYKVRWPWKRDPKELPENFELAKGRLRSLLNKLGKAKEKFQQYDAVFREQLESGVIEKVPAEEIVTENQVHYLCHHGVYTEGKSTKLRVVYDGSAKTKASNLSLNEAMFKGPLLLKDLTGILLRSRLRPILIVSDLAKAFLQMELYNEDKDVVRFLWVRDPNKPLTGKNLIIFRFNRVLFGIICSPMLLNATLIFHLGLEESDIADIFERDIYSDNPVISVETVEDGLIIYMEGKRIFLKGGWNLRQWDSNSDEFLSHLPEEDLVTGGTKSVLGLGWHREEDNYYVVDRFANRDIAAKTKRQVLRLLSMVFDPFGATVPCLVPHKLFMQNLWQKEDL